MINSKQLFSTFIVYIVFAYFHLKSCNIFKKKEKFIEQFNHLHIDIKITEKIMHCYKFE